MIRTKFQTKEQVKESICLANEYTAFYRIIKLVNAVFFIIIMGTILLKSPVFISFVLFFICLILNIFKVIDRVIDQFIIECPCEVAKFRHNADKIIKDKELLATYEKVRQMEERPYAKVIKKGKDLKVIEDDNKKVGIKLIGKWRFTKPATLYYTIDFDERKVF